MNYYDTILSQGADKIVKLKWLSEIISRREVLILSHTTLPDIGERYCILFQPDSQLQEENGKRIKSEENQYQLIGLRMVDGEFAIHNIIPVSNVIGARIFKEIDKNNSNKFYGTQYAELGYASYMYVARYIDGVLSHHYGMPFQCWKHDYDYEKIDYPINGNVIILDLWALEYEMFKDVKKTQYRA